MSDDNNLVAGVMAVDPYPNMDFDKINAVLKVVREELTDAEFRWFIKKLESGSP
jgi:DNA primase